MNTHFWIPFSIVAGPALLLAAIWETNRTRVSVDHDVPEASRSELSSYKILDGRELEQYSSSNGDRGRGCSRGYEFVYLYTESHPEFVAYRVKDICDINRCSCDIKISYLQKRWHDLSVPWQKAGNILPKGVRKW